MNAMTIGPPIHHQHHINTPPHHHHQYNPHPLPPPPQPFLLNNTFTPFPLEGVIDMKNFNNQIRHGTQTMEKAGAPQDTVQNAEYWGRLGCSFLIQDDLTSAFSAFEKFLLFSNDASSQNPVFWYAIGVMYMEYENHDFAAKCFEGALDMQQNTSTKLDLDRREIHFRLAICYREARSFEKALKTFEIASKDPPPPMTVSDVIFQMGLTHEMMAQNPKAQKIYSDLLSQHPQHALVAQQLAVASIKPLVGEKNGENSSSKNFLMQDESMSEMDFQKCTEVLEKVNNKLIHNSPKDRSQVLYMLGRCHLSCKQPNQAVSLFNQAVQLDATSPSYWFYLGRALSRTNEKTEAIHSFARALKLNPNLAEVWIELALEYESHQLFSDAVRCAEKAYELRKDAVCQKFLQDLQEKMMMDSDSSLHESTLASGTIMCPPAAPLALHPQPEELYTHPFDSDLSHFVHSYTPFGTGSFNHLEIDGRIIETEFV